MVKIRSSSKYLVQIIYLAIIVQIRIRRHGCGMICIIYTKRSLVLERARRSRMVSRVVCWWNTGPKDEGTEDRFCCQVLVTIEHVCLAIKVLAPRGNEFVEDKFHVCPTFVFLDKFCDLEAQQKQRVDSIKPCCEQAKRFVLDVSYKASYLGHSCMMIHVVGIEF
jgi:hypothetical protein